MLRARFPTPPAIEAKRKALTAIVEPRPKRNQRRSGFIRRQAGRVVVIDYTGARLHARIELLFPERRFQLSPMNEIVAHGVDPALGPPLGEQMVFVVVVDQ